VVGDFVASVRKTVIGLLRAGVKKCRRRSLQIAMVEKWDDCQLDCQTRGLWYFSADGVDD
jgi:hypothetical protein